MTSSFAVAKRPCDASCLSVVSFVASTVQYLEHSFLSLVTLASNLPVRTILFCSVDFGGCNVEPCCHTHDSRSTVIVYSARARLVDLML